MARRRVSFVITAKNKGFIKALDQSRRRLARFGRKMERMGRTLTRSITVPVGIAGGAAIKMASDFESSMTRIETLVGLSREQVQGMRKDVLRLAGETAQAPHDLSEALFAVTSAGLRGSDAMETLEMSAKASAIGLGETREIARATTAILQAYGKENINAAEATDKLTAIVREGNLEASELAPVLGRVVGIASQLDVSFSEVGASIATFTRLGVSAEEAVTGLRGIMNALLKPTEQGRKALDKVGLSFKQLRQQVSEDGLTAVLRNLVSAFDGNLEGLSKVIPRVRALAAVMGTAGAQGEQYSQILQNIEESTGIVNKGLERVSETTQFKFNEALSTLTATGIEFGTVMLPMVNKLLEGISKLAKHFQGLSKEVRTQAVLYAGLAAAAGPLLIVFGKMVSGLAAILSPAFLAKAALVGLFAATVTTGQWFVDNWDKISQGFENAMLTMDVAAAKMGRAVMKSIRAVIRFVMNKTPPGLLSKLFGIDLGGEISSFVGIDEEIDALTKRIDKKTRELVDGIQRYNEQAFGSFGDAARSALEQAKGAIINGLKGILNSQQIQELVERVSKMFEAATGTPSVEREGRPAGLSVPKDPKRLPVKQYKANLESMKAATTRFSSAAEAGLQGVNTRMGELNDLGNIVGRSLGRAFEQAFLHAQNLGDAIKNIGKQLLGRGILNFTTLLLSGGLGSAFSGGIFKGIGKIFGVGDALVTSKGDVVQFHPDDDILASKNLGGMLQPTIGGRQIIKNELFLDGQTVWNNQRRVNTNKRR